MRAVPLRVAGQRVPSDKRGDGTGQQSREYHDPAVDQWFPRAGSMRRPRRLDDRLDRVLHAGILAARGVGLQRILYNAARGSIWLV